MPFTDRQVAALKPKTDRYEVKEPGRTGLGVRVTPRGEKSWTFMYRIDRKQKRMTLGLYPAMSLSRAHRALAEAKDKLRNGIDPGAELAGVREAERNAESVADLAAEYIERHAKSNMKIEGLKECERILTRDVLPYIGKIKVRDITRRDLIGILDRIADRGAPVMMNRAATVLTGMFRFARDRGLRDDNPASEMRRQKERPRERVLTMEEINELWRGLDRLQAKSILPLSIKLMLATGQRRGEVVGMQWDEIEDDIWRLPAEQAKNGRENIIPLPPFVLGIISEIENHRVRERDNNMSPFLFPARVPGEHITGQAASKWVIRYRDVLGINDGTLHDLRRSFATAHGDIGTAPEIISALLNHTPTSITARVYNRAVMIEPRQRAMTRYADWLQFVIAGDFEAAKKMEGAEVKELSAVA